MYSRVYTKIFLKETKIIQKVFKNLSYTNRKNYETCNNLFESAKQ